VWQEVWPRWAPLDPEAAIPLMRARVTDLVSHYQNTIHYWDVVNEANGASYYRPQNGETAWVRRDGPAAVVESALGWARAAAAGRTEETFIYNDYDTGSSNEELLTQLQADGKLPDAIGIQSHMHGGEWPLSKVWRVCETFGRFGKPVHFTETTVLSGPRRAIDYNGPPPADWNTTPEGEAKQAEYVEQFYSLLFSHPAVRAITWWDFSDQGAWLHAPAGLVRKDMTPKPVYTRLLELIRHRWWTHASGKTDPSGIYAERVFYGDYRITVTGPGGGKQTKSLNFPEAAAPLTTTVELPPQ
jgi:GH35 family endo-1,4-beta-xylanase